MLRMSMLFVALSILEACGPGPGRAGMAAAMPLGVACDGLVPKRKPKHVFVIVLENESYEATFGATASSYLKGLADQGVLLTNYYGIGHNSLDNYIAMISGQAPNKLTQLDCPVFLDFVEMGDNEEVKSQAKVKLWQRAREFFDRDDESQGAAEYQQPIGIGCVYPAHVLTVADQLERRKPPLSWAAYMEGMPDRCVHPKINRLDDTRNRSSQASRYAVRHNPFAYFHSLIDSASCRSHDKPLGPSDGRTPGLARDLKAQDPPAFIFISPDVCNDGHNDCDGTGKAGKLARVDAFLRQWVPIIKSSTAYGDDGMIIVTFDEAEVEARLGDETLRENQKASEACCNERPGPSADDPGLFGPGGGRVGAVILSPLVEAGTVNTHEFNHYTLLKSMEDMFGLDHLGFAKPSDLRTFQECGVFKPDPPEAGRAPQP